MTEQDKLNSEKAELEKILDEKVTKRMSDIEDGTVKITPFKEPQDLKQSPLERSLALYQRKRWSKENFPKDDPPKKQTDKEIVRQLKLWYYELDQNPKIRNKKQTLWVLRTLDEIIGCWYD